MSWCWAHSGTCHQILLLVWRFLSESCYLLSMGHPLWRDDRSAVCNATTQWSVSRRTHNRSLLSHLRLPPTWRARFPYIYPPGTERPSYNPRHWVLFTSPHTTHRATVEVFSPAYTQGYLLHEVKVKVTYDWQSVSMSLYQAHSGTCDQIFLPVRRLLSESCGLVSVDHPLWQEDGSAICSAITQWS
jgi:hypothetical protein